jgi:hypothetical protein
VRLKPLALVVSVAVTAALVVAPVQGASADREQRTASSPAAARALAQAQALFAPKASSYAKRTTATASGSRDATMVLRRLRLERSNLSATGQASADLLLTRPITGRSECFDTVCVHWSTTGPDAATSEYVDEVAATAESVLARYAEAGYRAPESDGARGGNGLLDIYLQDLGSQSLYGYCDSDDSVPRSGPYDTWAYCAFDNNYDEFPSHTPLENLQVTAAHELFHAVQFAYDYDEDPWFMEATATWAEDELYDDVNDNLQYLPESPLSQPGASMDHFSGLRQYGDWIFFRYLTERFTDAEGGLPTIIRKIWERADGSSDGDDDYSVQAIAHELTARGTSLRSVFAGFADANRRPGASYEEGAANDYPVASVRQRTVTLSRGHRDTGELASKVDHLASSTYRFNRGSGLAAHALRVKVDLPPTSRGSAAVVTVRDTTGQTKTTTLNLSSAGDASHAFTFGSGVRYVEVTLVNASIRYSCGVAPKAGFSCGGRSRDDNLRMAVRAQAVT